MKIAAFIIWLVSICCDFTEKTAAEDSFPVDHVSVQSECRDRYLWIHVASQQTPRFEAVDENGIHSISKLLASRCGYTISTFKMDGFTTFRASYYSCFTHKQNDEVFSFRFNVMVSDGVGWISWPVSAVCSGLTWTHREIICEEDYMEVNVNRESSCGGQRGERGQTWQSVFSEAQRMASSVWQLMILQSDGQISSMSIGEAQRWGYSLTTTAQRVVLRSPYKQPHAELMMVDGVPVEVVRASLFFRQKLMVVMIDVTMACTVNSGSLDGAQLLWDIPWIVSPLVVEGAVFESQSLSLGVEGVLLDGPTTTARGFSLVQKGHLVQIRVPFGAEGGYRKSLVVNNMYKETYVIFLVYEHIFSLLYEDGSSVDSRHRMLRVLDTPLLCRPPFSLDQTVSDDQLFSIHLGNIPDDVILEEVQINGKQLVMSESAERGYSISPVVNATGSRAYELQLAFKDALVHSVYLGQGEVQHSIEVNFTLSIMPQRESYYHHTFVTARVLNEFPPEITAQCSDGGITFSVVRLPLAESLWEVGIDHEPLTSQLAAQRGYRLHNNTHRTTLEVPVSSIGYTYEDINLSNFYGTFKLLLRDSKSLEVQTSTSKRCLFKTQDMIVCSAGGTMIVVTTPASTWPTVQSERTTLLDPTCGPKQTDGSRVLFEFKLDSCGTRAMAGESYVVYENEILHDRQVIADGPNFISRESQFKLTVRCFYPLSGVNRLSVNRIFRSDTPGFGSVKVFKSLKADSANELSVQDCSHPVSKNAVISTNDPNQLPATDRVLPHSGIRPRPKPGASHFITVPAGHNKLLYSKILQTLPDLSPLLSESATINSHQVPQKVSAPGHFMSRTQDTQVFESQNGDHLPNFPLRYDQLPDNTVQMSNLNRLSFNSAKVRNENSGLSDDNLASELSSSSIPDSPVVGKLENDWGSFDQTQTHFSFGTRELTQQYESDVALRLYESSGGQMEMAKGEEIHGYQPQSQYDPSKTSQIHLVVQQPVQHSPDQTGSSELLLPGCDNKYVPANTKHMTSKNIVPNSSRDKQESTATSQLDLNLERPGSMDRRNIETAESRVQNIRVKPLGKLISSGSHLNQKRFLKQTHSQSSNPSKYATDQTAVNTGVNHWMFQHVPEHRGSNKREEHVPEKTGFSTMQQEQDVHGVRVESDRSAALHPTDLSTNQQGCQQNLVQSVPETGNGGGKENVSTPRNILQPTGASHIRVRPVLRLPGRFPNHNLQEPTSSFHSRGTYVSLIPQNIPNTPVTIRKYQPNNPNHNQDLNPTAGGGGFTGSHTDLHGAGGAGSNLKIHARSDCRSQYGASVHQGIIRGTQIS